jgi:hypothetical protein
MNLNVPDLRQKLRRNKKKSSSEKINDERRKLSDRREIDAEPVNEKKAKKVWLTPKMKALIEDLFFLSER